MLHLDVFLDHRLNSHVQPRNNRIREVIQFHDRDIHIVLLLKMVVGKERVIIGYNRGSKYLLSVPPKKNAPSRLVAITC
jgi:hypothetical protein